jgi:nucleotide-binding universal stress UspA family protein
VTRRPYLVSAAAEARAVIASTVGRGSPGSNNAGSFLRRSDGVSAPKDGAGQREGTGLPAATGRLDRSAAKTWSPAWAVEATAGTAERCASKRLVLVVGYDGSALAGRALDAAVDLLHGRDGSLEIVYVCHLPESPPASPEALEELRKLLDKREGDLAGRVRARLLSHHQLWHFSCREGRVEAVLEAVAADLHRQYGATADVVIVVGGAGYPYPPVDDSAGLSVVGSDRFPVMVVP